MSEQMRVTQFQILAKNPDRAADFYERAFGWQVRSDNALAYRTLETGGIAGGIWPAPPEGSAMVQLFLEVDDVSGAVGCATQAGAQVVIPPSTLPDGDEMAVILDPEGVPFGLFRKARTETREDQP